MSAALSDIDGHLIRPEDQTVLMINPDASVSSEISFQHLNLPIGSLIAVSHHILKQFVYFFQCGLVRLKL